MVGNYNLQPFIGLWGRTPALHKGWWKELKVFFPPSGSCILMSFTPVAGLLARCICLSSVSPQNPQGPQQNHWGISPSQTSSEPSGSSYRTHWCPRGKASSISDTSPSGSSMGIKALQCSGLPDPGPPCFFPMVRCALPASCQNIPCTAFS